MTPQALAAAARQLVGMPFRLHGRDPQTGLDCIGVLAAAMAMAGRPVALPNNYLLRSRSLPALTEVLADCRLADAQGPIEPGDVLILRPSACQFHLAIAAGPNRFVHAHAGLKQVVLAPGPLAWPVVEHWRLLPSV